MLFRNFARSVTLTALWLSSVIVMMAEEQPRLRYAVIDSDPGGRTHFREEFFPWQKTQSSDPKTPTMQTPFVDAQKLGFLTIPRGFSSEWHPAPGKRFVIVLSGLVELEVGSGERRKLGPGDVVLVTDVQGRGHITLNLKIIDEIGMQKVIARAPEFNIEREWSAAEVRAGVSIPLMPPDLAPF